jgi:hypothetical protein
MTYINNEPTLLPCANCDEPADLIAVWISNSTVAKAHFVCSNCQEGDYPKPYYIAQLLGQITDGESQ